MKYLFQHLINSILVVLLFVNISFAQGETGQNELLYISDYNIAWQHLAEWTNLHHEHTVPVLDALVEDEIITGWSAWQHHTGSEYNWRLIFQAADWADFEVYWEEFSKRFPEDVSERGSTMVKSHRDQIWNQSDFHLSESVENPVWAYEAQYQVNFSDMEAWDKDWNEKMVPTLEDAVAEGILGGWVARDHKAGDRFNRVVVYLFEEWDNIDDLMDKVMSDLLADQDRWQILGGMISAHDDVIWHTVASDTGNKTKRRKPKNSKTPLNSISSIFKTLKIIDCYENNYVGHFDSCTEFSYPNEQHKKLIVKANNEMINKGNFDFADEVFADEY
jgi:hypothetical protein